MFHCETQVLASCLGCMIFVQDCLKCYRFSAYSSHLKEELVSAVKSNAWATKLVKTYILYKHCPFSSLAKWKGVIVKHYLMRDKYVFKSRFNIDGIHF